jgi:hypothetical protein
MASRSAASEARNNVADQLGATRGMFHAGTLEIPIRMVQSVGDAIVLSVAAHELRQVLPGPSDVSPEKLTSSNPAKPSYPTFEMLRICPGADHRRGAVAMRH